MNDVIQTIYKELRILRARLIRVKMARAHAQLARLKSDQEHVFNSLKRNFPAIYATLKSHDISQFITPTWEKYNARVEEAFLPTPPFCFLNDPTIMETMFATRGGRCLREELKYLEWTIPKVRLEVLLEEDYAGDPVLLNTTYLTSHNSIHHLYHLIRFSKKTNCDLNEIDSVIEWGGGYGNMAKIFQRLKTKPSTYVIIDTPLFSCIQWLYLATAIGPGNVNLFQKPEDEIARQKINLLPVCFVDSVDISSDLFISTWGLSESSSFSQDYVVRRNWFDAKHILLAYSKSHGGTDRMAQIAAVTGIPSEEIEFLRGNYYSFR